MKGSSMSKSLKSRIAQGDQLFGISTSITTDKYEAEKTVSEGPYDFVLIDGQHSPVDQNKIADYSAMMAEMDVHVQFRIEHARNAYLIGHYLDLGVSGIEVPQVEEIAEVNESVANFYYSPAGVRSWGGRSRIGFDQGVDRHEYAKWWNNYGVLWIQAESVNAVTSIKKLATTGVDCVSIGPNDLRFDMERVGSKKFDSVETCVKHIVSQLEGTGITVCHRIYDIVEKQKFYDLGVNVILNGK